MKRTWALALAVLLSASFLGCPRTDNPFKVSVVPYGTNAQPQAEKEAPNLGLTVAPGGAVFKLTPTTPLAVPLIVKNGRIQYTDLEGNTFTVSVQGLTLQEPFEDKALESAKVGQEELVAALLVIGALVLPGISYNQALPFYQQTTSGGLSINVPMGPSVSQGVLILQIQSGVGGTVTTYTHTVRNKNIPTDGSGDLTVGIVAPPNGAVLQQGVSTTFTADSEGGEGSTTYSWTFTSPGQTTRVATGQSVTMTFDFTGQVTARVVATDQAGHSASDQITVTVQEGEPPLIAIRFTYPAPNTLLTANVVTPFKIEVTGPATRVWVLGPDNVNELGNNTAGGTHEFIYPENFMRNGVPLVTDIANPQNPQLPSYIYAFARDEQGRRYDASLAIRVRSNAKSDFCYDMQEMQKSWILDYLANEPLVLAPAQ